MTYNEIYADIEATVAAALTGIPIQTPNQFIDTSESEVWARITHLPASARSASLGSGGQRFRPGMSQIDIFTKPGQGPSTYPDAVVSQFPKDLSYSIQSGEVYSLIAYRDADELVEGWWMERVLVVWNSITSD